MPFRYSACLTLDKYTGVQTAIMGINEAAACEFIRNAEASGNADAYISKKCYENNIFVTKSYVPAFRDRRYRYYVAQTYEVVELFYRDFRSEFEEFNGRDCWEQQTIEKRKKEGDDSRLLEILRNVPRGNTLKPHPYFAVVEYYRVMRNCIVHAASKKESHKKLHKKLPKLRSKLGKLYGNETGKHYAFDAPNSIDELKLDDIRLYSRCIQRLARMISQLAAPDEQSMVNAVFGGSDGSAFRRSYNRFAGNPNHEQRSTRLKKALQFRLMGRFGLTAGEAMATLEKAPTPIA